MFVPTDLVTALKNWPAASQQRARRNAMIASTALAQRRAERIDVEEFLAQLAKNTGGDTGSDTAQPGVSRAVHN